MVNIYKQEVLMNKKQLEIKQIFPIETNTYLKDGFIITDEIKPKGTYFPPHSHDHFELELISDGLVEHIYNDTLYIDKKGSIHIFTYNDIHSLKMLEDTRIIKIRFDPNFLQPQLTGFLLIPTIRPMCRFDEKDLAYAVHQAEIIKSEQENEPDFYDIRTKHLISDIIIMILRYSDISSFSLPSDAIQRAIGIIIKDFKEDLSLSGLAGVLNLSTDYLGKLFKKSTGLSFNEYLNKIRIRHACKLLINSDFSVKEIAFSCGYNSVEYFMLIFKKTMSKTPMEYKSDMIGKINKSHA